MAEEQKPVSLRDHLEAIIEQNDKRYEARFKAQEEAVRKAEAAQQDYNTRSNEFRGQLDDQAKTLMPRPETQAMFKAYEEKLTDVRKNLEKGIADNKIEISEVKTKISTSGGKDMANESIENRRQWGVGLWVVGVIGVLNLIFEILRYAAKQ